VCKYDDAGTGEELRIVMTNVRRAYSTHLFTINHDQY
jgi:hypothetical protein